MEGDKKNRGDRGVEESVAAPMHGSWRREDERFRRGERYGMVMGVNEMEGEMRG